MTHPTMPSVIPTPDMDNYAPAMPISGDLNDQLLGTDFWTDDMVAAAGIPIIDVPFVTIGGGIGSFVTVDYLRIAGVPTDQIRVLSAIDFPWQTYEYLTRVSQIPRKERIRSDSASRPDNIWGFPSYALSEALKTKNPADPRARCSSSRCGPTSTRPRPAWCSSAWSASAAASATTRCSPRAWCASCAGARAAATSRS